METKPAITSLSALAHESRLAVFRLLVQAGTEGLAASKISETLGIPPSSLSFHLKELSHAGLVAGTQNGRFIHYAANYDAMNDLIAFMTGKLLRREYLFANMQTIQAQKFFGSMTSAMRSIKD